MSRVAVRSTIWGNVFFFQTSKIVRSEAITGYGYHGDTRDVGRIHFGNRKTAFLFFAVDSLDFQELVTTRKILQIHEQNMQLVEDYPKYCQKDPLGRSEQSVLASTKFKEINKLEIIYIS